MRKSTVKQCFLEFEVGDPIKFAEATAEYQLACKFLATPSAGHGLVANKPEDLTEDEAQLLCDLFASQPSWASMGQIRVAPPAPLSVGTIKIDLFDDVPKTCANFAALCAGFQSKSALLHYQGIPMHRIIPGFMAQGGDVTRRDGSGGDSIYSGAFNDEKPGLQRKHDQRGLLSMANGGRNTNKSQFFVTFEAAPQCDGKHVVFGRVVEGMEVLDALERVGSKDGTPSELVVVARCGTL